MEFSRKQRMQMGLQLWSRLLLILLLAVVIAYGSHRFDRQWDLTANQRHTLAQQSIQAIHAFPNGLTATIYVEEAADKQSPLRRLLDRYALHNKQMKIGAVDPDLDPGAAAKDGVQRVGQLVLRAGERRELVAEPTEEGITNALIRLAKTSKKRIRFLSGHGEHTLQAGERLGYSGVVTKLQEEGYDVATLELAKEAEGKVPEGVDVVILAGPRAPLFPHELAGLTAWWQAGGKLLLMLDPETDGGLQTLFAEYGITLQEGMVIDAGAQIMGNRPTTPLITEYDQEHPIMKALSNVPFLVTARGIAMDRSSVGPWQRSRLLAGAQQGWLERGSLTGGEVSFDPQQDVEGPILMGVTVKHEKRRLVLLADSDFAADAFARYPANGELMLNTVRWLAEDEDLIAIKPKKMVDAGLDISSDGITLLFILYVGVVPLLLLTTGGLIWWRRRQR
uniref:ABC-type uncharacterized transport system domain-containing protein n=1 Tax=Magnetococcus massalia (strain MO-1) TaxID=451514 RepID=A0A1S7LEI5_MAGMO|nr:Conserved protein of unknown function [Candidatus Magnetococcus massalia]